MDVVWQFIKDNAAAISAAAAVVAVFIGVFTGVFRLLIKTVIGALKLLKRIWKKATSKSVELPSDNISLAKLPTTSADVFGREAELAALDAAWDDRKINVVTFVAFGGVGKTALVNKWLRKLGE